MPAAGTAQALMPGEQAADPAPGPRLDGGPESGRCLVVGVLNVAPDSFSDDGKSFRPERAIERGIDLTHRGADIIEVGGLSPRPGAAPVPLAEEQRRVLPAVAALADAGAFVSISTSRSRVAADAVRAGARMVTDPSGGLADPAMLRMAAEIELPYVVRPGRDHGTGPRLRMAEGDVTAAVMTKLANRIDAATRAGIAFERLLIDPCLDSASTNQLYWQLLTQVRAFRQLGRPVLVGAPPKPLSGHPRPLAGPAGQEYAAGRWEGVASAVAVFAAAAGAWGVRTHDPRPALDAVQVAAGLRFR